LKPQQQNKTIQLKRNNKSDYSYKKEKDNWGDTRFKIDTEKRKLTHADGKVDEYDIKLNTRAKAIELKKGL
jgi:hypothetical protein